MNALKKISNAVHDFVSSESENKAKPSNTAATKKAHAKLTHKQIDSTIDDTFPASDPPSWY